MAILADEQDARVGGVGFGVDGEDDDRAVVADHVARGVDTARFGDLVASDKEDLALVDGLGGDRAGFAGELRGFALRKDFCGCRALRGHENRVNDGGGGFVTEFSLHRRGMLRIQRC